MQSASTAQAMAKYFCIFMAEVVQGTRGYSCAQDEFMQGDCRGELSKRYPRVAQALSARRLRQEAPRRLRLAVGSPEAFSKRGAESACRGASARRRHAACGSHGAHEQKGSDAM